MKETPDQLGYRMPAEWEPHEATWLAWPHNPEDWPGKFQAIPWLYAEIVRLLAAHERVHISCRTRKSSVAPPASSNAHTPTSTTSASTSGPPTASGPATPVPSSSATPQGDVAITNWRFNAWAKYPDWHLDDQIPGRAAELLGSAAVAADH